jgi:hypothetical protein
MRRDIGYHAIARERAGDGSDRRNAAQPGGHA